MVNFVKIIAVQGKVVSESKSGDTKLLSGSIKLSSNTKLIFSEDSIVVIQLANGRIVKIKGKDLNGSNGELDLNGKLFQELTVNQLSDLEKIENFATEYESVVETVNTDIVRLDDGRVFQRVGKDYVEVAADTFGSEDGGGNRFVQLTRVGEDGVADGISPLILNRVSEKLSPIDLFSINSSVTPEYLNRGDSSFTKDEINTPPIVSVSSDVQKEGEYLIHNVWLNKPSTGETKVIITLTGNDAELGVDTKTVEYSVDNGKTWILVTLDKNGSFEASIPPNSMNAQVRVSSAVDGLYEENESYNITVKTETQKTPSTATGTILDIDPQPTIKEITSDIKVEGQDLIHTVTLTNPSDTETTVTLTLTSETADLGTDTNKEVTYKITDKDGNITVVTEIVDSNKPFDVVVPPYVDRFEIIVNSMGDNWFEQPEIYDISAYTEYESTNEGKTATGTILDNEPLPQVTEVTSDRVVEGNQLKHSVTLNTASQLETTVKVTLTDGTATLGTDTKPAVVFQYEDKDENGNNVYKPLNVIDNKDGTYDVIVPPGVKDFEVLVDSIDDEHYEGGNEQYEISAKTAGQNDPAKGIGTIVDAQVLPEVATITDDSKFEGNDLTHTISLNNKSETPTTVEVSIKGNIAKSAIIGTDTNKIEYSVDGGKTWIETTLKAFDSNKGQDGSFMVDVPTGTQDIQVRIGSTTDDEFESQEAYSISAKVIHDNNNPGTEVTAIGEILDLNVVANSVTVYESGLSTGTNPTSETNKATISGNIDLTVITGIETITEVNIGGETFDLNTLQALTLTNSVEIDLGYGILKITGFEYESLESQTGILHYTFTLNEQQMHDLNTPQDEVLNKEIPLTIKAETESLGSATASNDFTIKIVDDKPIIKNDLTKVGSVTVDETTLGVPNEDENFVKNVFVTHYGADGESPLQYNLTTVDGTKTGLKDTETGKEILLYQNTNGVIEGRVGGETGSTAFTIDINPVTGAVTLTQKSALHHPNSSNPNEPVSLPEDSIKLTATATDKDLDSTISDPINVGNRFEFLDDAPTLDGAQTESVIVSEKYLPKGETPNVNELTQGQPITGVHYGTDGLKDVQFTNETINDLESLGYTADQQPLTYVLDSNNHVIKAYAGNKEIFTVEITNPTLNPAYSFSLKNPIDHVDAAGKEVSQLDFNFNHLDVFDKDDDKVQVDFKVTVTDDVERTEYDLHVLEDSKATDSANKTNYLGADVEGKHISILGADDQPLENGIKNSDGSVTYSENSGHGLKGSVIVNVDGTITYVPTTDYSNQTQPNGAVHGHENDVLKYQITKDDGKTINGQLNVKVDAISDAPTINVSKPIILVLEDTKTKLDLIVPKLSQDQNDKNSNISDNPELLGIITLTLSSNSASALSGAVLSTENGTILKPVNGSSVVNVVIVDENGYPDPNYHHVDVLKGQADIVYLTKAQYESIQITPASNQHENLNLNISVESYEVDDARKPLVGIDSEKAEENVRIDVHAVTEKDFELNSEFTKENPLVGIFDEDALYDLGKNLTTLFTDTDGSEQHWYSFSGLPPFSTITVDGVEYKANDKGEILTTNKTIVDSSKNGSPNITFTAPKDFSGDLKTEITIKLHVQDSDSDSKDAAPTVETNEIKLPIEFYVSPVAGDVAAANVSTQEDTVVTFLENVGVIDTDTGKEVITSVSFVLPEYWTLVWEPTNKEGWALQQDTETGEYTIKFDETLSREDRESLLDEFGILPPPHSSKDETIVVKVSSKDTNTIGGKDVSDEKTVSLNINVEVTPQAEVIGSDTDKDNKPDLVMNADHTYNVGVAEDTWFDLNTDFNLKTPWENQDGGQKIDHLEDTYAHFTAYTDNGKTLLEGASFQYSEDGGNTFKELIIIDGKPVIPVEYLNTVQFKGPENFKGEIQLKIEAITVDYDEDNIKNIDIKISGEAWLNFEVNIPVVDEMTLKVDPRIVSPEDQPIKLNIVPTSSDPNELFDVSISGIPEGSKIAYNGIIYDTQNGLTKENDGTYTLKIENYDSSKPPVLTPPKDSNKTINLNVNAQSKDAWGGASQVGKEQKLPINITLVGVPDAPKVTLNKDKIYEEKILDLNENQNQVELKDLIAKVTTGETSQDGSEKIILRLSDLPEGFSIVGVAPPIVIDGKPNWIVTLDQLNSGSAKIQLPKNYSGHVNFTAEVIVTENDNASNIAMVDESNDAVLIKEIDVNFKVTPSPEAELIEQSILLEDAINQVNFLPKYINGDTDETMSMVRIAVDNKNGLTFYSDKSGTTLAKIITDESGKQWYEINIAKGEEIYVQGPSNFDGDIKINTQYKVTDTAKNDTSLTQTSDWKTAEHIFTFKPVTDDFIVKVSQVTSGGQPLDIVGNQYVIQSENVTLSLNVDQKPDGQVNNQTDLDGSEHLEYILVKDVPNGVSVVGAIYIGQGQWKIAANSSFKSAVTESIEFKFDKNFSVDKEITIEVVTRDGLEGNLKSEELTWNVKYEASGSGIFNFPSVSLTKNEYEATEDIAFSLADVVDTSKAIISLTDSAQDTTKYDLTITLSTKPEDTIEYSGMTKTEILQDGKVVEILWTTTVSVSGSDADATLKQLLESIEVKAKDNANSNTHNLNGKLPFDITVTLSEGAYSTEGNVVNEIAVVPVTDPATISLSAKNVYDELNDEKSIELEFSVSNSADQFKDWAIVGSKIYFTLSSMSGQLFDQNGKELFLQTVSDVNGLAMGQYFVLDNVMPEDLYKLKYIPSNSEAGEDIQLQAWVQHYEMNGEVNLATNLLDFLVSEQIHVSTSGFEHTGENYGTIASLVKLNITEHLSSSSSNKSITDLKSIVLEQLPVGFSVWYSEGSDLPIQMANNAGGNGLTNTWTIPTFNDGLPNIYLQAPAHWSGTLDDLLLNLVTNQNEVISDKFNLTINPIADGIVVRPNLSFGVAGKPIDFNINAELKDPQNVKSNDQYTEYATLILSGFTDGLATEFLANGQALDSSQISYDSVTGKFTLLNLSQDQLDSLQFIHSGTNGLQAITIEAYSQEYDVITGKPVGERSAVDLKDSTINISANPIKLGDNDANAIFGSSTNDTLKGNAGNDKLVGGAGNDILYGGAGSDILYGGAGQDTFVWDVDAADGSKDIVADFNKSERDQIDVSQLLKSLGWDSSQSLSEYIGYSTISGQDTQLDIKHDKQSVSIVIENNTWTDFNEMLNQGNLKTEI